MIYEIFVVPVYANIKQVITSNHLVVTMIVTTKFIVTPVTTKLVVFLRILRSGRVRSSSSSAGWLR